MSDLMTPGEVADRFHVPERTLSQWRYLGAGPSYVKIGRHVRYREADITTWLERRTVRPGAA